MKIEDGKTIAHYRIISKIGSGGMGDVFLAEDTKLDRRVAIKFLNEEFSRETDKLGRFIREAKAASALNHPNILTVYEIGEAEGTNYIVTELVDGKTLREVLSARDDLLLNTILKIGVQVAEALSAAHAAGIVHRDIKPENIMIRRDGYAKVVDFGLAKLAERPLQTSSSEDATRAQINTSPGMVMGTVSYMSPEQARGSAVDARTDVWSLGVVLYEVLSGRLPFTGETTSHVIVSILEKEPLRIENVPDELSRILRKCLAKDAEMRYQSARDLVIDLKNLRRDLDIKGELERSVVPDRDSMPSMTSEGATQFYSAGGERTRSGQVSTGHVSGSSLEYAVNQAKSHKLATAIAAALIVAAVALVSYFAFFGRGPTGQIDSIAVLPFQNTSGNTDSEYLSDGLAESLIYRLSQFPNLKVSPASSVMRYKGKDVDAQKVAGELGVQAVMSGRIIQRGDNLNIRVELIDVANNKVIWGEQYEKKMSELLATQREIAATIADKLHLKISGEDAPGITKKYTENNEAYQAYLKGRFQWNKRTVEGLKAAEGFYKEAIEKDPSFALAYAGLADTYGLFSNYSVASPRDSLPQAKAAAMRSIELDPSLAEPHAAIALYHAAYTWDLDASVKELYRATELNPKYATAYHWIGNTLPALARCDEAIAAAKRAEELDPLSAIISADTAYDMVLCRRFDEAIAQTQKAFRIDPNFFYTHMVVGWAYLCKGDYRESAAALRRSNDLNPDPWAKALLVQALVRAGERAEAAKLLDELRADARRRYIDLYILAIGEAAIGNRDAAYAQLERTMLDRGGYAPSIGIDPTLDHLRGDPRFADIVKKVQSSRLE
jgi:eukaryotic-like serine/threonine-protein kinase